MVFTRDKGLKNTLCTLYRLINLKAYVTFKFHKKILNVQQTYVDIQVGLSIDDQLSTIHLNKHFHLTQCVWQHADILHQTGS